MPISLMKIQFKDRATGQIKNELVYGERILSILYADNFLSTLFAKFSSHVSLISRLYGMMQNCPHTRRKILPFIKEYGIDVSEFAEPVSQFRSFNDFFIRKLKPEARPIAKASAVMPADGRFLFYQNIESHDGFVIKGKKFCLAKLLDDPSLASNYARASMVIARLCPSDYHRFHFPCTGIPNKPKLINGPLYSVNPISLRKNISLLAENKRMITEIDSEQFGKVIYIEVGATNVGSIHQTYTPDKRYEKGEEKGFFSFGGSCLIILFPPDSIQFDTDLIESSLGHQEMLCLMGQSLGTEKLEI